MIDLYHILGLKKGVTDKEIKKAFRVLAKQYHPDVNPDAAANEKFNEVYMAYEILTDTKKRSLYDSLLLSENDESDGYETYENSYVNEWQKQAYQTAQSFSNMTYQDFRDNKILLHQWSSNIVVEYLVSFGIVILLVFGIVVIVNTLPFEGSEMELNLKEKQMGLGILMCIVSVVILTHTAIVQFNNFAIRRSLN